MPSAPDPIRKRWLPRLRFSLRTLVILVLLIGSAGGLWWRWQPWTVLWQYSTHDGKLENALFAPDGTKLLVKNLDTTLVFNTRNWQAYPPLEGYSYEMEFSPDGTRLLLQRSADWSAPDPPDSKPVSELLVYDAQTLKVIHRIPYDGEVWSEHFSRSGKFIATLNSIRQSNGTVGKFWDAESGRLISTVYDGEFTIGITFIDDELAATNHYAPSPDMAIIWKVHDGSEVNHNSPNVPQWPPSCSERLHWSANSLTVTDDAGNALIMHGDAGDTVDGCVSRDGSRAATVSKDGALRVWDIAAQSLVATVSFCSGGDSEHVAFSPDGSMIVTTGGDNAVRVWHRRRPERWWGVAWLPEFWLTALFAGALVWSVWRDRTRQVCRDSDLSADLR